MNKAAKLCRAAVRIITSRDWRMHYLVYSPIGRLMPSEKYLKCIYKLQMGKELDLGNPQSFNEKLQWLKLHDHNPLYTTLVDKYAVRGYIKEKLGEEYLIPLVGGPYASVDEIDFDQLPDQFVLKCTHDSASVTICRDRATFDIAAAKKKLNKALKVNFFYFGREWPYKNVKPQIIAEKYMENSVDGELRDYKLMCFHSKVKATFTCTDRFTESGIKVTFYDTDWKRLPFERHYPVSSVDIEKPKTYEEMIGIAEKLSADIPFVRIDFYEIQGRIYFGEFTFYPGCGFEEFRPESWDAELGNWIKIPNKYLGGGGYLLSHTGYVLWLHDNQNNTEHLNYKGLTDYKFYCFQGKVKFLYVSDGLENHETARISFLTPKWEKAPFGRSDYMSHEKLPQRPVNFEKMIRVAEYLSKEVLFLRVDLFELKGQIYFSELTFYPCCGFMPFDPEEWDQKLGNELVLPYK